MINYQPLYQNLGYLFYSIAAADKEIRAKEIKELHEAVEEKWMAFENSTDEYGTDAAQYISIAFEYLTDTLPDAEEAYENFEVYYKDHPEIFTERLKHKIIETASAIGHSFAGINKSELTVLAKLTLLFSK